MSASCRDRAPRARIALASTLVALFIPAPAFAESAPFDAARYGALLEQIAAQRRELGDRYAAARGARARAAIRDEARRFVVGTLVSDIFPAWMGMPSGGGRQATASLPHEPGMYISCSYFLTAALQNVGLLLESRTRFAQAPASWIEHALLPPGGQIYRYGNLSGAELEQRLVGLGDGLYVVGLNIHVGFIVVAGGHARFVHSSYTPPGTVVDEPVVSSEAIALSRSKGYWVSPLFKDDRIVEMWLRRQPVPAPPAWRPGVDRWCPAPG